jgi:hypothetical protein
MISARMSPAGPVSAPRRSRRHGVRGVGALLGFGLTSLVLAGFSAGVASAGSTDPAAPAATTSAASTPTTTYAPSGGVAPGAAATTPTASTPGVATAGATPTTPPATTPATSVPATSTPQASTPTPTKAGTPQAKKSNSDRPLSTGAIVIAALALLLLLGCIAWALARRRAFEPHWLLSLRHAMAEAGFRASATWSEFTDWARLGR